MIAKSSGSSVWRIGCGRQSVACRSIGDALPERADLRAGLGVLQQHLVEARAASRGRTCSPGSRRWRGRWRAGPGGPARRACPTRRCRGHAPCSQVIGPAAASLRAMDAIQVNAVLLRGTAARPQADARARRSSGRVLERHAGHGLLNLAGAVLVASCPTTSRPARACASPSRRSRPTTSSCASSPTRRRPRPQQPRRAGAPASPLPLPGGAQARARWSRRGRGRAARRRATQGGHRPLRLAALGRVECGSCSGRTGWSPASARRAGRAVALAGEHAGELRAASRARWATPSTSTSAPRRERGWTSVPDEPPRARPRCATTRRAGGAPKVTATGRGLIADRIVEEAEKAGVPVRHDAALAQALAGPRARARGARGAVGRGRRGSRVGLRARCQGARGRALERRGPRGRAPGVATRSGRRGRARRPSTARRSGLRGRPGPLGRDRARVTDERREGEDEPVAQHGRRRYGGTRCQTRQASARRRGVVRREHGHGGMAHPIGRPAALETAVAALVHASDSSADRASDHPGVALRLTDTSSRRRPPPRPSPRTSLSLDRARTALAVGDLAAYRALAAETADITDPHRRYVARRTLIDLGLAGRAPTRRRHARASCSPPRDRPRRCSTADPAEPVLLNLAGVALFQLGALARRRGALRGRRRARPRRPEPPGQRRRARQAAAAGARR